MTNVKNTNPEEIPELVRSFFDALREPDPDENHTFGIVRGLVNGEPHWLIAAIEQDPNGQQLIIAMFMDIPDGQTLSIDGVEGTFITEEDILGMKGKKS